MKKLFIILYLLTNIFVLGACGDVESEGDPQPRVPRVEVESDDYYVQITQENMDGVAFVYLHSKDVVPQRVIPERESDEG